MSKHEKQKTLSELQFEYPHSSNWRDAGKHQKIFGSEFVKHEPITKISSSPSKIEFKLRDVDRFYAMGPNTRFQIEGQFQHRTAKTNTAEPGPWLPCDVANAATVIVAPNWKEMLIQNIDVYHGDLKISNSDEGRYVFPYLNAFFYNYMDKENKKKLCIEKCHTGYGVPSKKDSWTLAAESEWRKYSENIFVGTKKVSYAWRPLDLSPLFQGSNYLTDNQKALPMPLIKNLSISILFHDHLDSIFKKKDDDLKEYRFQFLDFYLVIEHLRLNPTFYKDFLSKKKMLEYQGVTRILRAETIPNGASTYVANIQRIAFPESLFIFALPKQVLSGTYNYKDSTDSNVFRPHNIQTVKFTYNELDFYFKIPNIGNVNLDSMNLKRLNDYITNPPGMRKMDREKIDYNLIDNGAAETPYPHVYINLCNLGDRTRLIPFLNNGSCLEKNSNLELELTFGAGGATNDCQYIIYSLFSDAALCLDVSDKQHTFFTSPYIKLV